MERYRNASVLVLILAFVITSSVLFTELPLLAPHLRLLYAVTKMLITTSWLGCAYWLYKDIRSQAANTVTGISFMVYCCHGQFFRPTYYFAVLQMLMMLSFMFPITQVRFRMIAIGGSIAFLIVTYVTWDHFETLNIRATYTDITQVIIGAAMIALICNTYFSSERTIREEYNKRFAQIGLQTARTVHDLKGLISAPKLYVQLLKSRHEGSVDAETVEILDLLARDLESLQGVLQELNQLSVSNPQGTEFVKVSDIVVSLRLLLRKKLSDIDLTCTTEMEIKYPRSLLTSIMLNVVINAIDAIDAFNSPGTSRRAIEISSSKNILTIADNAGGFDPTVLRDLKQRHFVPRQSQSGMGLLFVTDEMGKLKGSVDFENVKDGAQIRLTFPKKIVRNKAVHLIHQADV